MNEITKIFESCLEISTTTKHDVFFQYAPHVNCFSVHYYIDGYVKGKESVYAGAKDGEIFCQIELTDSYIIEQIIAELNELNDIK